VDLYGALVSCGVPKRIYDDDDDDDDQGSKET